MEARILYHCPQCWALRDVPKIDQVMADVEVCPLCGGMVYENGLAIDQTLECNLYRISDGPP